MIARPAPRQTAPVLHIARGRSGEVLRDEMLVSVLAPWEGQLASEDDLRYAETLAIRRDAGLGDCVMLQATWAALKAKMPHLRITFFCPESYVPLFEPDPDLEAVLPYRAFAGGFDVDANLHHYVERHPARDGQPRVKLFATAFGLDLAGRTPTVHLREPPIMPDEPRVAVTLNSALQHRTWPYAEELVALLRERGVWASLVDGHPMPGEPLSGLPLDVLARELAVCHVIVSPDTGILHLAGALQHYGRARVIGLFGPVDPLLRVTCYPTVRYVVRRNLPCVPCAEGVPHLTCRKPGGPSPCLEAITPKEVLEYVLAWL